MRHGFSLVELSIVLVILGLLAGGVLTGQSLIRAAELRSVTTEFSKYQAAVNTFRDKYFSLPGDMTNATSFWGVAHATPATCKTTASTSTATCNGDGNGQLYQIAGSYEPFRAWQHMAAAGLIEGSYTGAASSGGVDHAEPGVNVPKGKLSTAGWMFEYIGSFTGSLFYFDGSYGTQMRFGGNDGSGWVNTNILLPEEAWNIDTKMDDGKPGQGNVYTMKATAGVGCATTDVSATAEYSLTTTSKTCRIFFKTGF